MAIPKFDSSHPILQPQAIESSAKSYEDFANVLGGLAQHIEKEVVTTSDEISNSVLANAVADAENLKNKAKIDFIHDPNNVQKITENTINGLNAIKGSAKLNDADEAKLNKYLVSSNQDVMLDSARLISNQNIRQSYINHNIQWPSMLQVLTETAKSEPNKIDTVQNSMFKYLNNLFVNKVITKPELSNAIKSMGHSLSVAHDFLLEYGSSNSDAQSFHAINASPLNSPQEMASLPVNENFKWHEAFYSGDHSLRSMLSNVASGILPNNEDFSQASDENRKSVMQATLGYQEAKGLTLPGHPYSIIYEEHQRLDNIKYPNYRDTFKKNELQKFLVSINNDYAGTIGETPAGAKVNQDFVQSMAALDNMHLTPEVYEKQKRQLYDKKATGLVSIGQAQNIPDSLIVPFGKEEINQVTKAFTIGENPHSLLDITSRYSETNQARLAYALPSDHQKIILNALSYLPTDESRSHGISIQDKLDFIAANQTGVTKERLNQKGRNFDKDLEELTKANSVLKTSIYSNLTNQIQLISQLTDRAKFIQTRDAMIDSTLNYARYLAAQNGYPQNPEKYIDKATLIYERSLQPRSGVNWIVNGRQNIVGNMTDYELDILANHAIEKGREYIKSHANNSDSDDFVNRPLRMIITPSGQVEAVDQYGSVSFSEPLTTPLRAQILINKINREDEVRKINEELAPIYNTMKSRL